MLERLRVLIVDDNADFVESQCILLGLEGHFCQSASDVPGGVQAAKRFQPDVILFDLGMPGNGFTLPWQVRQVCDRPPLLLCVSGYADAKTRQRLAADGIRLLPKPVEFDSLRVALTRLAIAEVA
jgi:CheY-like chemotaxis protein